MLGKTDAIQEYTHAARFLSQEAFKDLYLNTQVCVTNAAVQSLYVLPGDSQNPIIYGDAEFISVYTGRVQFMTCRAYHSDAEFEEETREHYHILPAVERDESDVVLEYDLQSQDVTNWTPWLTLDQLKETEIRVFTPYSEDASVQLLYDKMNSVQTNIRIEGLGNHIPVALLVFILPLPKVLPPPLSPEEADEHDPTKTVYPAFKREITEETDLNQIRTDKLFISVTCSLQESQDFFSSFNAGDNPEDVYCRHCSDLSYYLERSLNENLKTAGLII